MFDFLKRNQKDRKDRKDKPYLAAERTEAPLSNFMVRLMAEELPILDSADRVKVYRILEAYDGPTITSQEELPEEIRQIMNL